MPLSSDYEKLPNHHLYHADFYHRATTGHFGATGKNDYHNASYFTRGQATYVLVAGMNNTLFGENKIERSISIIQNHFRFFAGFDIKSG